MQLQTDNSTDTNTELSNIEEKLLNFEEEIRDIRRELIGHQLFSKVNDAAKMNFFMSSHVFAVWDFMSLLKSLQRQLTCTRHPWLPPVNQTAARLINEIVLCEESDEVAPGLFCSHFDLYLEAMTLCGACDHNVREFVAKLQRGCAVEEALVESQVPKHVYHFVMSTMSFIDLKPHEVAAAFLFGREDIIPDMFTSIINECPSTKQEKFSMLKLYLDRHIELDGDTHGPMGKRIMATLCASDDTKWNEALIVAKKAISARIQFWDGIESSLNTL